MLSSFLLPFILFVLTFLLTALYFSHNKQPSPSPSLVKCYPIVGTLPHVIKNSNRMLDWSTELLAASPTGTVSVFPLVFTADPSSIEHITKSNFDNYPKSDFLTGSFHDLMGDGIINVDGKPWKLQRKMASYEFNTGSLRTFVLEKVLHEIQDRFVPLLKSASRDREIVDLQDVLERFAFDSICCVVFDYDPDCLSKKNEEGDRFFRNFEVAAHLSIERAMLPFSAIWKLKKLLDVASERRLRESLEMVNGIIDKFISSKRLDTGSIQKRDFLSQFAKDGSQSNKSLRDILVSFVLAGRDTTPSALTWFFWIISSRPDIVDNIREEIRSIRASHELDESFTLDSLREMSYLHAALSESMRLYPPVSLQARECASDDTLPDGTAVRKGWMVMYNTFAMGRTKRIWGEDCEEFRPERWLVDGFFRAKNPFEYPVFHAGPRMCLGKDMAFIQMKAVAASILERFEMEVMEERGKHQVSMTLRMEGGLPVRVEERNVASCSM